MNVHHRRTHGALSPTVHIAHQSSMHRHLSTIHTPPQLLDIVYTIEWIPMSYCIDSLAMRITPMNRLCLSISHCEPRVLHHIMHDKLGKPLIHMNCNYTPLWQLCSDSRQLHSIEGVAIAETEGTCNHMDRSGIGKQQHHRCDWMAKCSNFGFHPIRRNLQINRSLFQIHSSLHRAIHVHSVLHTLKVIWTHHNECTIEEIWKCSCNNSCYAKQKKIAAVT